MRHGLKHFVQFYGKDETALIDSVQSFLADGLKGDSPGIVIATNDHLEKFRDALSGHRNVLFLDAHEALAKFMAGGKPNRALFDATIGKAVRERAPSGYLHAYGEMVAVLWEAGNQDAAIRLEELWNELLASVPFALYCGYPLEGQDERIVAVHSEWVEDLKSA
ncbi:MAG: MEDS domain-containing protein [Vulcanimicrobiaceae bacterium]